MAAWFWPPLRPIDEQIEEWKTKYRHQYAGASEGFLTGIARSALLALNHFTALDSLDGWTMAEEFEFWVTGWDPQWPQWRPLVDLVPLRGGEEPDHLNVLQIYERLRKAKKLYVHREQHVAWLGRRLFVLTERQSHVLRTLAAHAGQLVPSEELKAYQGSSERIDAIINRMPHPMPSIIRRRSGHGGGYIITIPVKLTHADPSAEADVRD